MDSPRLTHAHYRDEQRHEQKQGLRAVAGEGFRGIGQLNFNHAPSCLRIAEGDGMDQQGQVVEPKAYQVNAKQGLPEGMAARQDENAERCREQYAAGIFHQNQLRTEEEDFQSGEFPNLDHAAGVYHSAEQVYQRQRRMTMRVALGYKQRLAVY